MKKIRVLVIDDSAYNRRTISRILEGLPDVEVVGYAVDGEEGIRRVLQLKPDLITLDIEMPRMDGFTLLRIIMGKMPTPVIVVSSHGGDDRVFKALDLGAMDFIVKPTVDPSVQLQCIRDDLLEKVRSIFNLNMSSIRRRGEMVQQPPAVIKPSVARKHGDMDRRQPVSVVAIGASTGGPPALQSIFAALPGELPFAVVVAQHMPAGFTRTFAERLDRIAGFPVSEAQDGAIVRSGSALIAPGGRNMLFRREGDSVVVEICDPDPREHYLPSVDKMFASCADHFGSNLLGVVLTGMGNDGSKGVRVIKDAGGQVLSEAEETAVIFGMPREALATGSVDAVVPLGRMAAEILARSVSSGN